MIKRAIDTLIQKGYLQRCDDGESYSYIAWKQFYQKKKRRRGEYQANMKSNFILNSNELSQK